MNITTYIIIALSTLLAAWMLDAIFLVISWLSDYPKRRRLDLGFISRIRWYEGWFR